MALITNATIYTFGGIQFNRMADGSFPSWFALTVGYTVDPVLEGDPYVDTGALAYPELVIRAWCANETDRATLKGLVRTRGTLANDRSPPRTAQVVLVEAPEVQLPSGTIVLDLTFRKYG